MSDSANSVPRFALNAASNIFLGAGALVFFLGDRLLRRAYHWDFWSAEVVGIGSGVVLLMLGGLLRVTANRKSWEE